MKFLKEWNGHQPDTFNYVEEMQARVLIKDEIAEPAYEGEQPKMPLNVTEIIPTKSRRRSRLV